MLTHKLKQDLEGEHKAVADYGERKNQAASEGDTQLASHLSEIQSDEKDHRQILTNQIKKRTTMPAVSKAQQRLMAAAEHGADFPMAKKVRKSMSHDQMHDFAVGSQKGKPEHVVKGQSADVMNENTKTFKNKGMNEHEATKAAIRTSGRHKNLGNFLHPRKDGKPHGS